MKLSTFIQTFVLSAIVFCGFAVAEERTANAQGLSTVIGTWNFENEPNTGWWLGGNAGYGSWSGAHSGTHDIWIRNWNPSVWNSANVQISPAGYGATRGYCDVSWYQRTGSTLSGATITAFENLGSSGLSYLDARSLGANGDPWALRSARLTVDRAVNHVNPVILTFGFWGNGSDQWIGLDDVHVECYVYN